LTEVFVNPLCNSAVIGERKGKTNVSSRNKRIQPKKPGELHCVQGGMIHN